MKKHVRSTIFAGIAILAASGPIAAIVNAAEYCVVCSEPPAVYRCQSEGGASSPSTSQQLVCLQTLSRDGGHASCAVRRGMSPGQCDGPVRSVAATLGPPMPPPSAVGAASLVPNAGAVGAKPDAAAPPATVAEAARLAKAKTDAQFKKTGEKLDEQAKATGTALKKTWTCLASLFTRCGEE